MNKRLIFFLIMVGQIANILAQELDYDSGEMKIESAILTENRKIELFHPKEKSDAQVAFYVLDGNWNYDLVKGTLGHWIKWDLMPKAVVVSIDNMGKRSRDLTPTKDDTRFPGSGGAQAFLEFVASELKPKVQKEFGNIQYNVLVGHSFGGLFSLFVLKEQPGLFDGYIAISPSVWWKDNYMYGPFKPIVNDKKPYVFITAGTDDRGNTKASKDFTAWLEKEGISQELELKSEIMQGEDHFSNVPISLHRGLQFLFPKQKWANDMISRYDSHGLEALKQSTEELSNVYGIRFTFPLDALLKRSLGLTGNNKTDDAIKLLSWIQSEKPENYQPSYYLGYIFKNQKDSGRAIRSYQKALQIGGMPDRMKTVIKREIEQLLPPVEKMGGLSSEKVETSVAFSPDETKAYVSMHNGKWGSRENPPSKIYEYQNIEGQWQFVGISVFSQMDTKDSDSDVFISYNGDEAFFTSTRTYPGKEDANPDIWKSEWKEGAWSNPEPLRMVNSRGYEASPVTDAEGNLYFSSMREGGIGLGDFYWANRKDDGSYDAPKLLNGEINGVSGEWNLLVAPNTEWILFESSGRPEGLSAFGDMYVCVKTAEGWSKPRHLEGLNTTGSELNMRYLPNSKRLVFVSSRKLENPDTDIYEVDFKEIESYINEKQKQ